MPSNKPKFLLVLEQELMDQIDKYQADNNLLSRAEAVRRLIKNALERETGIISEILQSLESLKSRMEILEKDMDEIARKTDYHKRMARQKKQQTVSAGNDEDNPLHRSIIINK